MCPALQEKQPTALPLSRLSFKNEEPSEPSGFLAEMETNSIKFEARSPFAALSGRGDVFDTQSEMIQSVRDGVHIDAEMIPCMELKDTSLASDGNLLMNADVFDYQHSSSQDDVLKWNGLNYKESWEVWHCRACTGGSFLDVQNYLNWSVQVVGLLKKWEPRLEQGKSSLHCVVSHLGGELLPAESKN